MSEVRVFKAKAVKSILSSFQMKSSCLLEISTLALLLAYFGCASETLSHTPTGSVQRVCRQATRGGGVGFRAQGARERDMHRFVPQTQRKERAKC